MRECNEGVVHIKNHEPETVRLMLEFIYLDTINDLEHESPQTIIALLGLADEYLLDDLKQLCQSCVKKIISVSNALELLCASEKYNAEALRSACKLASVSTLGVS